MKCLIQWEQLYTPEGESRGIIYFNASTGPWGDTVWSGCVVDLSSRLEPIGYERACVWGEQVQLPCTVPRRSERYR
jgi:hypothetical protein